MRTLLRMLALFVRSCLLDYRARWHYRRLERHERLMHRHGHALSASAYEAARIRRGLTHA